MKLKFNFILLLLSIFLALSSCEKKTVNESLTELTEEEKTEIINSYNAISSQVDDILLDGANMSELQTHIQQFKEQSGVEDVWLEDYSLFVKFEKGGVVSWINPPDIIVPSHKRNFNFEIIKNRSTAGNNKVCLINQVYSDERFQHCRGIIDNLNQEFSNSNFDVTVINGGEFDIDFVSEELSQFGIIFIISHGIYSKGHTWIVTGDERYHGSSFWEDVFGKYFLPWYSGKISFQELKNEVRNGDTISAYYYSFSEKFVETSFNESSFDNSLMYLSACQGFKSTTQLAESFVSKGAGIVIGWNETNTIGAFSGNIFLEHLLSGKTVDEALGLMHDTLIHNECEHEGSVYYADLVYYPNSAGNMYIISNNDEANINITFPEDGGTYTTNELTLTGNVEGMYIVENGTVTVNGVSSDITDINGNNFIHPIIITEGSNTIIVSISGQTSTGSPISATKEIYVTGNFTVSVPSISTASVTVTSSTSAVSGGHGLNNNGYEITAKGVCWNTTGNPTIEDDHTNDGSGSVAFGSTIEGLTPNTTYYIRAYATNSQGTGYGAELQFTTFQY